MARSWMCRCAYREMSLLKVDKDKFDTLLSKLMRTPPEPAKAIETQGKAGKIIPPIPQSAPRKA